MIDKMRIPNIVIIIFVLLSSLFAELKVGDSAPTFYLRTLEERNFFFSDTLKKTQPVILSFFATWCIPCRLEIPVLDSLKKEYSNVKFYLINVSRLKVNDKALVEDSLKVATMMNELKVDMQVLMDLYGKTAEKYNVKELPTLIAINSEGKISSIHKGYSKGDEKKIIAILNNFTDEKK